jgi:hypothetical protein
LNNYVVATERRGWPKRREWAAPFVLLLGEWQGKLRYEDSPDEPTATCHLQTSPEEAALCDHPWEALGVIPGQPSWADLHPEMRCEDCAAAAGVETEDPTGRVYRYRWSDAGSES